MSVNVPLHKWRSADPAILIGRRCIAQNGKGEYKVPPNTCFEPSLPPTLVYILGKEAE